MSKVVRDANSVDAHVGSRLRLRRTLMGLSQQQVAQALGVAFQQVQKYEKGANRLSASRLHSLGKLLCVSQAFFFEGLRGVRSSQEEAASDNAMARRETIEFVRAYYRITDPQLRLCLAGLIKAFAADKLRAKRSRKGASVKDRKAATG